MTLGRRRAIAIALSATLGTWLLVAGCAITKEENPSLIARDEVPAGLVESTTTTTVPGANATTSYLYVVLTGETTPELLVPCVVGLEEGLEATDPPAAWATAAVEALIELVPGEQAACLPRTTNALPPELQILSARVVDRVLELDLANLGDVGGSGQRRAVAQIVWTATAINGIDGVRFKVDGVDQSVAVEGGSSNAGEVITRGDFPSFNGQATTTTTTTAPPPTEPPPTEPPPAEAPPP